VSGLEGRRVAVIGGAGFIGHNLALELDRRGAEVSIVDGLQVNNMLAVSNDAEYEPHRPLYLKIINERLELLREADIPLAVQDARDYHALGHLLSDFKPHVIVHAAAVSHAGRSNKDPYSTFDHSLRTLENALDYARNNCDQFVYLSSSMVYGDFETPEVDEEHPLNSIGIYGALKVSGEKIVASYEPVFDLPYTIIRPSALYGQRCISRRVGQVFIENALAGRPVKIQGDGSDRLDFTYIEDLVDGICLTVERPEARNQVFNLTYGASRSIAELAEIVRGYFPDLEIENVERDKLMPERGTLSIAKARALLGYEPKHPIEDGFAKYIEWYRSLVDVPAYR
jgi:nucleoside-diphosphate-sugar epimerase